MKQNPDFERRCRIKMASAVLNIKAIDTELKKYDRYALQKSAAIGAHRNERIKYAALIRQRELEKQAFLGALKSMWNSGKSALGNVGQGISNAWSGKDGGLSAGLQRAGTDLKYGARRAGNQIAAPFQQGAAAIGGAVKGLGQGVDNLAAAPGQVGRGIANAGKSLAQAPSNAWNGTNGGLGGSLQRAGNQFTGGFQQAGNTLANKTPAAGGPGSGMLAGAQRGIGQTANAVGQVGTGMAGMAGAGAGRLGSLAASGLR